MCSNKLAAIPGKIHGDIMDNQEKPAARLGAGFLQGHLFGRPRGEPCLAPLLQGFWKTLQSTSRTEIL
jgi:hypothetical protein